MTSKAYHRLILTDGTVHEMVVVRFDAEGRFIDFHALQGEEPFVEWHGGTLDLRAIQQ